MTPLDYLKQVVPEDLIPRMKTQGFLRGATISLIMDKYPELSVEQVYNVVYQLTGQISEKTKRIKIGEFFMKEGSLTMIGEEATLYSEEEVELIRKTLTKEMKERMTVE